MEQNTSRYIRVPTKEQNEDRQRIDMAEIGMQEKMVYKGTLLTKLFIMDKEFWNGTGRF